MLNSQRDRIGASEVCSLHAELVDFQFVNSLQNAVVLGRVLISQTYLKIVL